MRFRVPQNIDMQDRIVGPLTMAQFAYAVIGSGLAWGTYTSLPKPFSMGVAVLIAFITICVIFVKINEQPFLTFIGHMFIYALNPKQMVWNQVDKPSISVQFYSAKKTEDKDITAMTSSDEINEIAGKLDSIRQKLIINKK